MTPASEGGRAGRLKLRSLVLVVLSGVAILAGAPPVAAQDKAQPPAPPPAPRPLPDYLLAPGDILRVGVWKEPELSAEVFVRLDGKITVPLVGDVRAAGRTTEQLASEVTTRLESFLEVPQATVTLSQAVSARFFVIGEVARPGTYPLTGRTTVLQALALAGGFREFAKRGQILVVRDNGDTPLSLRVNFDELGRGTRLEQNVVLQPGDTVVVP